MCTWCFLCGKTSCPHEREAAASSSTPNCDPDGPDTEPGGWLFNWLRGN